MIFTTLVALGGTKCAFQHRCCSVLSRAELDSWDFVLPPCAWIVLNVMNLYADLAAIIHTRGAANIMGPLDLLKFFCNLSIQTNPYSKSNQFDFIELQIKPIYTFQIWRLWLQHMYRYWSDPYDYNSLAQVHSCWDGMVINLMEYWGKMRPSFPPTQLKIWEITTSQPSVVHSITHQSQRVSLPYLYLRVLSLVPAACWGRIYAYWYVCTYKTNWQDQMCLS